MNRKKKKKETDRQTDRQTDKQTDRQVKWNQKGSTNRQRQTGGIKGTERV